jgi:hypothetical protein
MRKKTRIDYPKISVVSLIQRASDVAAACTRDHKELNDAGLDWKKVENLESLIAPCSDIEAEYSYQKQQKKEKTAHMRKRMAQCLSLRDSTIKAARAAFILAGIKANVPSFPRKRSGASLIQDLSDIAAFCHLNADQLKKTPFDFNLAEKAAQTAKELSDELATYEYIKSEPSKFLEKRNRTCKEIYKTMVDICGIGRHVFWNDPDRRKAYKSRD